MNKEAYRCFLYKQVEGKTVSHIFVGQAAVDEALADGWHTTFADFVQSDDLTPAQIETVKDVCSIAVGDANILANVDEIEDLDMIKDAYERISQKKMHHKVNTLKGARKVVKKALGEINGINQ